MITVVVLVMVDGSVFICEMLLFLKLMIVSLPRAGFGADPKLSLSSSKPHADILEMSRVPERLLLSKYLPGNYNDPL
jgi:hypothetical protein